LNYKTGEDIDYEIRLISDLTNRCAVEDFWCGNDYISKYLQIKAFDDPCNVTYVVLEKTTEHKKDVVLGFFTLCCSGIYCNNTESAPEKKDDSGESVTLSAIKCDYFAIRKDLHGLPYTAESKRAKFNFGDWIFYELIRKCIEIGRKYVGAQYLILYSVPDKVQFYRRNRLQEFKPYMFRDNTYAISDCVPMFMSLQG
jgi:hypothetical protein